MNSTLKLALLFFFLLFLQVFVLKNILFLGYVNPYLYIVFIFYFPLKENRFGFLFSSFLLGLCIDFFLDSGGIHAFSILCVAYIRLFFIRFYFRKTVLDYPFFKLQSESFGKLFNYAVTLTFIHHLILFSFANFSFQNMGHVVLNTVFSGIFTLLVFFLGNYIFTKTQ